MKKKVGIRFSRRLSMYMKRQSPRIMLILLPLALAGCSKSSPDRSASPTTNSIAQIGNYQDRLAKIIARNTNAAPRQADDKNVVLPGRHMSEYQVIELASSQLPANANYRCEFKDGVWEIMEVQKDVWGVSSTSTTPDRKIRIESTNATRMVLRVRDVDGKVEPIKTP